MVVQDLMLKAAWLRPCNDAALASLKNSLRIFNPGEAGNEPKKASYAGIGVTV